MQEKWAALLANAADPNAELSILPSFSEILKQLSAKEVAILESIFFLATSLRPPAIKKPYRGSWVSTGILKHDASVSDDELEILLNDLFRLGLCQQEDNSVAVSSSGQADRGSVSLSPFGFAFVSARRPPLKKKEIRRDYSFRA